jgi:uncharacterized metal-binding protein YceD (DUF177 family)
MTDTPEFSHPVSALDITKTHHIVLKAKAAELAALTRRLDLVRLDSLSAKVELGPTTRRGIIPLQGTLTADIVQTCCVTLEEFSTHVEEAFSTEYAPADVIARDFPHQEDDEDGRDVPEVIENGEIDVGEVVTQYLSLTLSPYPRKPGVVFDAAVLGEDAADSTDNGRQNPFAGLKGLLKD